MFDRSSLVVTLTLAIGLSLSSCGNDSSGSKTSDAAFASLWTNVFENRCGSCHGVTTNSETLGGPDMRTQDAFHSGMVNKKGSDYASWETFQQLRADCTSYGFITPGNPNQSLLVAIFDSTVKPCTVKNHTEPTQSIAITGDQLTQLKTWITSGAAR